MEKLSNGQKLFVMLLWRSAVVIMIISNIFKTDSTLLFMAVILFAPTIDKIIFDY